MSSGVAETLSEALDAAATVELDTLDDSELDAELVALLRAAHRLDAEIARRTNCWDRRGVWAGDGSRSPAARLSRDAKVAHPAAKRLLRRSHAIAAMPHTLTAWQHGEISADHIDRLAAAAGGGRGDLFTRDEQLLVEQCASLRPAQAAKAIAYWQQRADAEIGNDGTPPPSAESSMDTRTHHDGTVTGRFHLDPIGGATVTEALRRIERDLYRTDKRAGVVRTKAERMAAALVEMAVRATTPDKKGHRPEPLVVILAGETTIEHLCELANGTVIHPGFIVPHLSRCAIQSFIFDGAHRVVAASKQRTFRGTLRRAIQARDRHCQHPAGCDASIVECDIDHITPHAHGGPTSESDGRLQCEPHNRKSDLHNRAPADVIEAARQRRRLEHLARQRLDQLITDHANRPPPTAA